MKKHISLIMSLLFTLYSCDNKETSSEAQRFSLHFGESREVPFRLSDMVDSVSYITLSGNDVGMVDEVKYVNGLYYLCDKKQGTVQVFDDSGNFVRKLNNKGRAKNEYISIGDFDVSFSDGSIHVFDDYTGRMLVYSNDLSFLNSKRVGNDAIKDFAIMENGDYLMYKPDYAEGSNRGLWIADNDMNLKEQLVSIDDDFRFGGIYPNYLIRRDKDTFGLMGGEDKDNIYEIANGKIARVYHIDIDIDIPKSVRESVSMDFEGNAGHIYTKNNYIETSRWLSFMVTDMQTYTMFVYDKKNGIQHQLTKEEDIIEDITMYGNPAHLYGDVVYCILYPDIILNSVFLKAKFPNVTKDSNPVIVLAKYSE